ncbi:phosphatase PAP2 family protein [Glaciihabitans arcticus]|uniref:Phosphatase PAP2 family protein n=1 Tax=Glaciihabitans arcticus TaxID=2668039 RepID=A0A4Q9GMB3_9MICO|nr:phosphatase PAP2 family protein [Glaciihabitans arcticus]TBN55442.1 phosphatase PAP2 family protein [Glaciihabitans arcticus]
MPTTSETTPPDSRDTARISRFWPLVSGAAAVVTAVLLGLIILIRGNLPFEADAEWMEEIVEHRTPFLESASYVMNFLGGGWFAVFAVPLGGALVLLLFRRYWAATFYVIALAVSAAVVQLLKGLYDRPRPEDILVVVDEGSFPSGHTANAATLAVVLGLLLWRWWVWAAGAIYVVAMMVSRTYLGAHWFSDTIGGLLLGAAVAIIVWAPLAHRLRIETGRSAR